MPELPKLVEPEILVDQLSNPNILIVDLCNDQLYSRKHIPGAVHVSPKELVCGIPPATGKLPSEEHLSALISRLGITDETHVIAYDDEGGGWAGRFIWTLDVIGHSRWSYLNGGFIAWCNEGHPTQEEIPSRQAIERDIHINTDVVTEAEDIMAQLDNDNFLVWDARSLAEYTGERVLAQKAGHIPGAVHCEWTSLMDQNRNLRLREDAADYLSGLGITPDKIITTHCQSHHRSGFTYLVARLLEFPNISAYHGSWSEWGNRADTPVELSTGANL